METNPFDSPRTETQEPVTPDKPWWKLTVVECLVVGFIILILIGLLIPSTTSHPRRTPTFQSVMHLKAIGVALHYYCDEHGTLPPAYVTDDTGLPLYSWRVLVLPYLDEKDLFDRFDLSQAWDSEANLPLVQEMPECYANPWAPGKEVIGETSYLALVDKKHGKTVLRPDNARTLSEIPDGAEASAMVVSHPEKFVVWTAPTDIDPLDFIAASAGWKPDEDSPDTVFLLMANRVVFRSQEEVEQNLVPAAYCDDGRIGKVR